MPDAASLRDLLAELKAKNDEDFKAFLRHIMSAKDSDNIAEMSKDLSIFVCPIAFARYWWRMTSAVSMNAQTVTCDMIRKALQEAGCTEEEKSAE